LLVPKHWPPQYNWNTVESGVKHHNPNSKHHHWVDDTARNQHMYNLHHESYMCDWVSDCCLTPIQQYYGENKLIFNDTMMWIIYEYRILFWLYQSYQVLIVLQIDCFNQILIFDANYFLCMYAFMCIPTTQRQHHIVT
jgi:hypothetical protein